MHSRGQRANATGPAGHLGIAQRDMVQAQQDENNVVIHSSTVTKQAVVHSR